MKKLNFTTIVMVTGLLLLSSMAMAQPGNCDQGNGKGRHTMGGRGHGGGGPVGHGMKGDRMGHLLRIADELELTEAQIEQLKKLRTDFQLQMVDARAEMQKAGIQFRSLKQASDVKESTVFAAIDDQAELRAEMKKRQFAHHQEMQSVLTPEQQEKAKELRFKRDQRGDNRWQSDDDDNDHGHFGQGRRGR